MKIICDTCGAKYSIADEKVRGKVFKIRCKKCREIIVVRGTMGSEAPGPAEQHEAAAAPNEAQAPEAAAGDYGSLDPAVDPVWHVVLDGEQQGPYTAEQVGQFVAAGQLDHEAYCWRDGFGDWVHVGDVDELRGALAGAQAPAAGYDQAAAAAPAAAAPAAAVGMAEAAQAAPAAADDGAGFSGFTAPASTEGADNAQEAMAGLFGDTPGAEAAAATAAAGGADMGDLGAGRSSQVAARDAGHDGGADLFAQSEDGGMFPSGGGSDVLTSSPRVDIGRMTGTRNENSVLFSLSNLQALASDNSGAVSGAMPAAGPGGPTPGAASGPSEGSGLIDIRAMAAQVGEGEEGGNGVDDLLAIGGGGGFAPTLGAPVLMAQPAERSNKVLYGVIGVGAALFIGLVIILIVSLSGDDETAVAANQPTVLVEQTPGSGAAAAPGTGTAPAQHAAVQPTPVAASDDEGSASAGESGSGSQSGRGSRRGSRRRGGARSGGGGESGSSPAAEAPAAAPAPQAKRAKNDLDSLLDGALGGGGGGGRQARKKSGGGGGSNLPSKLSRAQVRGGMSSIQGRVRRCGNGTPGTVVVNVVISGSTGRVSSATVTGQFAGTAVGSCVARAVRGARFSRFRESNLTVRGYPFRVN